jgi:hypothetical protein
VTVRITKIDTVPNIDLNNYVAISGQFTIHDSFGKKVKLAFSREHKAASDDLHITDRNGEGWTSVLTEDSEDYGIAGGQFTDQDWNMMLYYLASAITDIEERAGYLAEQAWKRVWAHYAITAEASE